MAFGQLELAHSLRCLLRLVSKASLKTSPILTIERFQPSRPASGMGSALRLGMFLGVCGGFLLAYQRSSRVFTITSLYFADNSTLLGMD